MKSNKVLPLIGLIVSASLFAHSALAKSPEGKTDSKINKTSTSKKIRKIPESVESQASQRASISVIVELNSKKHRAILKAMKAAAEESNVENNQSLRQLVKDSSPKGQYATKGEERVALEKTRGNQPFFLKESIKNINESRERNKNAAKSQYKKALKSAAKTQHEKFKRIVERLGGEVTDYIYTNNSIVVNIPSRALDQLARHPDVIKISENSPGEPELDSQIISLNVNPFWSDGNDGGVWDVGILDTGVEESHSALSGHTFLENYTSNGSHGTGIACMYGSTDATLRGLAFGLDKIIVDNAGSAATSMAGADWMVNTAADDPEVINYSFGNGTAANSSWGSMARFVDGVVHNHSVVWVKSAGNAGFGDSTTLTQPGENYNGITVTNMDDKNTNTRSDDVIRTSSSRGPTADGRRKPDIAAPGHNTSTCGLGNTFTTLGGTSSAAPKVGAVALLLQDSGHSFPISMKATMINTADSWDDADTETTTDDGQVSGKEWNRTYGWGYLDAWHAEFHKADYFIDTITSSGTTNDHKFYVGQGWVGDKATLVWERDVSYNDDDAPTEFSNLSDLNMRLYDEQDQALEDYDFASKDNVHQVAVKESGIKVIKVYAWNSSQSERIALATEEGFTRADPPSFSHVKSSSAFSLAGPGIYIVKTSVSNTGDIKAHNVNVSISVPSGMNLISSQSSASLDNLEAAESKDATWVIETFNTSLLNSIVYTATSSSYGENYSNSSN